MNKYHIQGALITISLISFGVLIWNHLPVADDNLSFFWAPGIIGIFVAGLVEVFLDS